MLKYSLTAYADNVKMGENVPPYAWRHLANGEFRITTIKTSCSVGVAGIKIFAAPSKKSEVVDLYKVIWNDLLPFINCYRHKLDMNILHQAALSFSTTSK